MLGRLATMTTLRHLLMALTTLAPLHAAAAGGVNPDGVSSLTLRGQLKLPNEIHRSWNDLRTSPNFAQQHAGDRWSQQGADAAWFLELRLPSTPWLTQGLGFGAVHFSEGSYENSLVTTWDNSVPPGTTVTTRVNQSMSRAGTGWQFSVMERFHTSGRSWNRSAAQGGSPWGRIWHPTIEARMNLGYDNVEGVIFDIVGGVLLPVRSWLALDGRMEALESPNAFWGGPMVALAGVHLSLPWFNHGEESENTELGLFVDVQPTVGSRPFKLSLARDLNPTLRMELAWLGYDSSLEGVRTLFRGGSTRPGEFRQAYQAGLRYSFGR